MSKLRILRVNDHVYNLSKFYKFWLSKDGSEWFLYGAISQNENEIFIMKLENREDALRFLNNLTDQLTCE